MRPELICIILEYNHQDNTPFGVVAPCLGRLRALFLALVSHHVTSDASPERFDEFVIHVLYSSCTINLDLIYYNYTTLYILRRILYVHTCLLMILMLE